MLHLRETTEIDVRTSLLHLLHFLEALFQLFHRLICSIGMQYILHRVFLFFLNAKTGNG